MHFDSLFSLLVILKRLGVKNLFSFYTISVSLCPNWQYFWSLKPSMTLHETNPDLQMSLR